MDPGGQRREGFFGLKGRFCQPRPQAWELRQYGNSTLKGSFGFGHWAGSNGPFRAAVSAITVSQAFGLG